MNVKIGVIKHDISTGNDVTLPKGMLALWLFNDGPLLRMRTPKGDLSVWSSQVYFPPDDHPLAPLLRSVAPMLTPGISPTMHLGMCRHFLTRAIRAAVPPNNVHVELQAALELLEYYERHKNTWDGYPKGLEYFLCCIGRAVLATIEQHVPALPVTIHNNPGPREESQHRVTTSRSRPHVDTPGTDPSRARGLARGFARLLSTVLTTIGGIFHHS